MSLILIIDARCPTSTATVLVIESETAVSVAEPSATEVTRPAADTVTTLVAEDDHTIVGEFIAKPFLSVPVAVTVVVSPNEVKSSESFDIASVAAICWTFTVDVCSISPPPPPVLAVIVVVPASLAYKYSTLFLSSILAILQSSKSHHTSRSAMTAPAESFTTAVSAKLSFIAVSVHTESTTILAASCPTFT